jgi:hypothetical protein
MFQNTCTKCSKVFDTKNPNRIVCPNCLYPTRQDEGQYSQPRPQYGGDRSSYPPREGGGYGAPRPQYGGDRSSYPPREGGGYGAPRPQYGGDRPSYPPREGGGYGAPRPQYGGDRPSYPPREGGGYGAPRPQYGGDRPSYPPREGGGYGAPRPGGYGPRPGGGGRPGGPPRRGPGGPRRAPKPLLIPKEVLLELEKRYMPLLPLPNPDVHEVLAGQLNIEPSKAFFGINLVRMKLKLPKLDYPKRKLAVSPDQLMAIETMYTPYMTMENPPIGIHKIIAKQLKLDEWRVHVGIGLIRKAKNIPRWNTSRDDLPDHMKTHLASLDTLTDTPPVVVAETLATPDVEEAAKPLKKPMRKAPAKKVEAAEPAKEDASEEDTALLATPATETDDTPVPKKRGRPKKTTTAEGSDAE